MSNSKILANKENISRGSPKKNSKFLKKKSKVFGNKSKFKGKKR